MAASTRASGFSNRPVLELALLLSLSRSLSRLAPLCCALLLLLAHATTAEIVRIQNHALRVGFDRNTAQLVELVDLATGQNFAVTPPADALWQLEFTGVHPLTLTPENARRRTVELVPGPAASMQPRRTAQNPRQAQRADADRISLRITWSQFDLPSSPAFQVIASIELDGTNSLSKWRLALEKPGTMMPATIRFPRILDLPRLTDERLALPFWLGQLSRNPRALLHSDNPRGIRRELDYPGHGSMQCLAFYSESGPGLYLAADDAAGYRKAFAAFSSAHTSASSLPTPPGTDVNLEIVHSPERSQVLPNAYSIPYGIVLGTFHGTWFDAAEIYRSWATNQAWAAHSRLKRGLVPDWIQDTGLWVWNRGRATNVIEPAISMRTTLGLPVNVFWHWWHGCAYDTGFPEYIPPRDGATAFTAAMAAAHKQDVHALVYMNQRLWGMTTASWTNEHAARFAVKRADGKVHPEVYNTFSKLPCASMCIGTPFWRGKYAGLATEAFNSLDVDGIYMDQACSSLSCFDPRHGHPLGGGTYWMNGFKQLAADIRKRTQPHGTVALAGEGCAENWLPYLDIMLALDVSRERYTGPDQLEPIPFFTAVYHGYGTFYGSYSSLTMPPYDDLWPPAFAPKQPLKLLDPKFQRQFCLEQARSVVWGQQPTLANFQPSQIGDRPEEIAFVIRLARERRNALQYLQHGTMLAPPAITDAPTEDIPMSRLSIYAGQQDALKEFHQPATLVLASAWRAPDGGTAVVLANIAERPLSPRILMRASTYGLPEKVRARPIGTPGQQTLAITKDGILTIQPTLQARDVRVIELVPD